MRFVYPLQSISPGCTRTAIGEGSKVPEEIMSLFKDLAVLEPEEIANAVLYVLGTAPHVQVSLSHTGLTFVCFLFFYFSTCSLPALLSIISLGLSFFFTPYYLI
jgi:hypothetical protein